MKFSMNQLFSIISAVFFVTLFISCKKDNEDLNIDRKKVFDIVLVAGQSNTCSGIGLNYLIDTPDTLVKQLGRFENDMKVIDAIEPLDHWSKSQDKIGFALTFAKEYIRANLLDSGKYLLIIPCGKGGTGFKKKEWNRGGVLYNDAIDRVNRVLRANNMNRIVAILWHQGEEDVNYDNYQADLDTMILGMRLDIKSNYISNIPFILGGMVPFWVENYLNADKQQRIIENTVNRIMYTGYANPYLPSVLMRENNTYDFIHYNAEQQRELGRRYFSEYKKIILSR
jgi:hypothetical protein